MCIFEYEGYAIEGTLERHKFYEVKWRSWGNEYNLITGGDVPKRIRKKLILSRRNK